VSQACKSSGNTIDEEGAKKAGGVNAAESDWDSESEGAWAAEEIDGEIVALSGASPSLFFGFVDCWRAFRCGGIPSYEP